MRRAASIDGEDRIFRERKLPALFGSNPLIQRRALALLPWGQAPRRREDESFRLKFLRHVGNR